MPRKKSTVGKLNSGNSSDKMKWGVTFINIHLNPEDIASIEAMELSESDMLLELFRLSENGYKVSLNYDNNNNCGIASITGGDGCIPETNEKKCLVSRGPDVHSAVLVMLYKLAHYCPDGHFPIDDDYERRIWS